MRSSGLRGVSPTRARVVASATVTRLSIALAVLYLLADVFPGCGARPPEPEPVEDASETRDE